MAWLWHTDAGGVSLCDRHGPEVPKIVFSAVFLKHTALSALQQLLLFSLQCFLWGQLQLKFLSNFQNKISVHLNKDPNWALHLKMPPC